MTIDSKCIPHYTRIRLVWQPISMIPGLNLETTDENDEGSSD